MKRLQAITKSKRRLTHFSVGITLALVLILTPILTSLAGLLSGTETTTVSAATTLPQRENPGFCLTNQRYPLGYYSHLATAGFFFWESSCSRCYTVGASRWYGNESLAASGVQGPKSGSWTAKFTSKNPSTGKSIDISSLPDADDLEYYIRASVTINGNGVVSMGDGVTMTTVSGSGCYRLETGWQPFTTDTVVFSGSSSYYDTVMNIYYFIADLTAPGDNGWSYSVETAEDGAQIIWMDCGEQLFGADEASLSDVQSHVKIKLGLVPYDNQYGAVTYVTAYAIGLNEAGTGIGFQIQDSDWEKIGGTSWKIISVADASDSGSYDITLFFSDYPTHTSTHTYMSTINRPLCDYAGNPLALPSGDSVRSKNLYLDADAPEVDQILMYGSAIGTSEDSGDTDSTGDADSSGSTDSTDDTGSSDTADTSEDSWAEDIDSSSLFSTEGDTITFELQMSEQMKTLSEEELANIQLTLNLKDAEGNAVVLSATGMTNTTANGGSEAVTVLEFESATITKGMTPEQEQLRPVSLSTGGLIEDKYGNVAEDTIDLSSVYPDKQNYLDFTAPTVTVGNFVQEGDNQYTIPVTITDANSSGIYASVLGTTAQMAVTADSMPLTEYSYTIDTAATWPVDEDGNAVTELENTGTFGSSAVWSEFALTKEGTYYVHLQIDLEDGLEISDESGITLHFEAQDTLGNTAEVSSSLTNMSLDKTVTSLELSVYYTRVTRNYSTGENMATFMARATAEDINGISRMEYQWAESEAEAESPAENSWSTMYPNYYDKWTDVLETIVNSTDDVTRILVVRAYDTHGNVLTKTLAFTADLSRTVSRYAVTGTTDTPSADTDVIVYAPSVPSSDTSSEESEGTEDTGTEDTGTEDTGTEDAETEDSGTEDTDSTTSESWTRVLLTVGDNTYARIFHFIDGTLETTEDDTTGTTDGDTADNTDGDITGTTDGGTTDTAGTTDGGTGSDGAADEESGSGESDAEGESDTADTDTVDETGYSLFDFSDSAVWYQLTNPVYSEADGELLTCTAVEEVTLTAADFYGTVTIQFSSSSMRDLMPVANEYLKDTSDTSFQQDETFTIQYAPERDDVHEVSFNSVKDVTGTAVSTTTQKVSSSVSYTYYRQDLTMSGTQVAFSISNALKSSWKVQDINFDESYMVLVRLATDGSVVTDEDGNPDTSYEVTERLALAAGTSQIFSIPSVDKDGNTFTTGAYGIIVHIAQNAGGSQDFYSSDDGYILLLDKTTLPTRAGVFEYSTTTTVTYDDTPLTLTTTAADGEVLRTVNVGVATPYRYYGSDNLKEKNEDLVEIDGAAFYTLETFNGTQTITDTTGAGSFTLNIQVEMDTETWLGTDLGEVECIRMWNAASSGTSEDVEYTYKSDTKNFSTSGNMATLAVKMYLNEANSNCIILSEEELAARSVRYFAVTTGTNTICYQFKTTNGQESPIYQFQLNICDEAPEVEFNVELGGGTVYYEYYGSGSDDYMKVIDSLTVSLGDAFSPYGDITLYYVAMDNSTGDWIFTACEDNTVTESSYLSGGGSYYGSFGTSDYAYGYSYVLTKTTTFFVAVDPVGNAVGLYPILGSGWQRGDSDFYYTLGSGADDGIDGKTAELTDEGDYYQVAVTADTRSADLAYDCDYLTLQIDDNDAVAIPVSGCADISFDEANSAGLLSYIYQWSSVTKNVIVEYEDTPEYNYDYDATFYIDALRFVLPYDPTIAEGETVTHTVRVVEYGYADAAGNRTTKELLNTTVDAVNTAPTLELDVDGTAAVGAVPVTSNAYLRETGIDGNTFAKSFTAAVFENGTYNLTVEDKYGAEYTFALEVENLPDDPSVTYSTQDYTTGPVTVTVHTDLYADSLTVLDVNGLMAADGTDSDEETTGTSAILTVDDSALSESGDLVLTFTANGTVYIQYEIADETDADAGSGETGETGTDAGSGETDETDAEDGNAETDENATVTTVTFPVVVDNIYTPVDVDPYIVWSYDEQSVLAYWDEETQTMVADENIYYGDVTAYLMDRNGSRIIDPLTGETPQYTFVPGAVEGDTYTFSGYTNIYGQEVPDTTATLACTLKTGADAFLAEGEEVADTYSPDLAIEGYTLSTGGTSRAADAAYTLVNERPEDSYFGLDTGLYEFEYSNVYTNIDDLLAEMGWGASYLFRVTAADESNVKLFVKEEAYGDVPDYETGESDDIAGVTLLGRTVSVAENVTFTLYAVDECGNYSAVRFGVESLGDVPIPDSAVVMENGNSVAKIYLLPPNISGGTVKDLKLTSASASGADGVAAELAVSTEEDESSDYYGYEYVQVEEDATVALNWSYSYDDITYTSVDNGALTILISGIDTEAPVLVSTGKVQYPLWSANYDSTGESYTNEEISVQFAFDKTIAQVYVVSAEDKETYLSDGSGSGSGGSITLDDIAAYAVDLETWQAETGVSISWLESRITVNYTDNADAYYLVAAAANGKYFGLTMPAVSTIDLDPPEVTVADESSWTYAANYKTVTVTMTANETVSLQETTGLTKTDGAAAKVNGVLNRTGTGFEFTFSANGTYTYHVADRAGNMTEVTITIEDLVTDTLTLELAWDAEGENIIDPATEQVDIGDTVYVKVNRAATITLNGETAIYDGSGTTDGSGTAGDGETADDSGTTDGTGTADGSETSGATAAVTYTSAIPADTWTPVTITEDSAGMYPIIKAADAYGNSAVAQLLYIKIGDRVAPTVLVGRSVVSVSADLSTDEIDKLLLANLVYSDNLTPKADITVEISYDTSALTAGNKLPVTYTVTDGDGNSTEATCWLKVKQTAEPEIYVLEGTYGLEDIDFETISDTLRVEWEEGTISGSRTVTLAIKTSGEPYKIDYKAGIKTAAQLKTGATSLCGYTADETAVITLTLDGSGYYTFLVTTQSRETYRFLIYVKE